MSRFFRKSKKTFAVLLTIAFVLSMVAVPAFAATTYSSLTAPTVPDNDNQKLGVISIEIDPLVEDLHEAWVEVEDGWDINYVSVIAAIDENEDPIPAGRIMIGTDTVVVDDSPAVPGADGLWQRPESVWVDDDSFTLSVDTSDLAAVEIWLEFTSVDVDDTGNIRAYFTNLVGQLDSGDVLIGRGAAGELELSVREYDYFSDQGDVTIRVIEDTVGTFVYGDTMDLRLPRGFSWDATAFSAEAVFGWDDADAVQFSVSDDGRTLYVEFDGYSEGRRSAVDLVSDRYGIEVSDPARAQKGEVVAEVRGDYDTVPDELVVGFYGDFEYTVTPEDAETVYAGRTEQGIADISISEEIAGTFITGRTITFRLPDWAIWGDLPDEEDHRGVEVELARFYGRDGREAVYRIVDDAIDTPGADPATLDFEDMEIVLSPAAPVGEDVVVSIAGSAGVRGEIVVGTVAAPATLEVDPVWTIGIGRSGQSIGTVTVTEAEAGMFKEGKDLRLRLARDVTWDGNFNVEVTEGDVTLSSIRRGDDNRDLLIRIDVESDEASTIQVTGTITTLRTVPEGNTIIGLTGTGILDTTDWEALTDQYDADDEALPFTGWLNMYEDIQVIAANNVFAGQTTAAAAVLANVGVAAPPVVEPDPAVVMMWIGSTTYTVDGVEGQMDVAPFIENDRTFVPVRFIAEALGAEADWGPEDALTEWVTLTRGDMVVTLTIGSNIITVTDGDETYTVMSDVAAQIVNDRTFLPARAVGEIFGAEFDWGPKDALTEWVSFTQ